MKKMLMLIAALVMASSSGFSEEMKQEINATAGKKMPMKFQAVSADKAQILQEGKNKMYCPKCGMTLPMFYKTNHAARVHGKAAQYCSIHCLALAMQEDANVADIKVVDNTTLAFIDATKAWYVFGSSKPGTMSMISKYAFGNKADAEMFAKDFGGEIMNFDATIASVKSTLAQESAMIEKRQAMMAQKGGMIYREMCKPTDIKFKSVAEAKTYLTTQKPCGELDSNQLQLIGLYLKTLNK